MAVGQPVVADVVGTVVAGRLGTPATAAEEAAIVLLAATDTAAAAVAATAAVAMAALMEGVQATATTAIPAEAKIAAGGKRLCFRRAALRDLLRGLRSVRNPPFRPSFIKILLAELLPSTLCSLLMLMRNFLNCLVSCVRLDSLFCNLLSVCHTSSLSLPFVAP